MDFEKIPEHLRCDEGGVEKPRYKTEDFQAEQEFFRSYPVNLQEDEEAKARKGSTKPKNFPGMLIKPVVSSVDWSHLSEPEDRWIYKPNQGIGRFGCFAPQIALEETLAVIALHDLSFRPQHEPLRHSKDDDENYSHCHLEFWKGSELIENEEAFFNSLEQCERVPFKLTLRRYMGKKIKYRKNPESDWSGPDEI